MQVQTIRNHRMMNQMEKLVENQIFMTIKIAFFDSKLRMYVHFTVSPPANQR